MFWLGTPEHASAARRVVLIIMTLSVRLPDEHIYKPLQQVWRSSQLSQNQGSPSNRRSREDQVAERLKTCSLCKGLISLFQGTT
jgi:hypothetical protein